MRSLLRPLFSLFFITTVLTGVVYPFAVTVLAQGLFPYQANGSLVVDKNRVLGSELIGQPFSEPGYFWGRPSATTPAYNASASSGSNLGPTNPALLDSVLKRSLVLQSADPTQQQPIPIDLVTSSGSGLDPHISIAAARYQIPRVAKARGLSTEDVQTLVDKYTEKPRFGIWGEPRVSVLLLNLALDQQTKRSQ